MLNKSIPETIVLVLVTQYMTRTKNFILKEGLILPQIKKKKKKVHEKKQI